MFKSLMAAATLLFAATAHSQGPVAYWSFDSGIDRFYADDSISPNRQLIAIAKEEAVKSVPGVIGKAISFTGPGYLLQVRNSMNEFNYPKVTVEAIVRYTAGDHTIFQYSEYSPGISTGYWFGFIPGGYLEFTTGNDAVRPAWNRTQSGPNVVQPGRVYHVAGVLDDNGFNKVYLDGLEIGSQPTAGYKPYNGVARVACNYGDGAANGWFTDGGGLDELKLWNRALSSQEIRSHYLAVKDSIDKANTTP